MPAQPGGAEGDDRPLLTRRQASLLLVGGLSAAAACSVRGGAARSGPAVAGRRADRIRALAPPATTSGVSLQDALARRRSVRSFTREPVSDEQLGQTLWAAQGVTRDWGGRTAPSAGALYPLDLYVVTAKRLWRYLPAGHRVAEWDLGHDLRRPLYAATPTQTAVRDAPVVVVVTGTVHRTAVKYGSRAQRYVALEAGHCTQNLVLEVTALGLAAVTVGAFADEAVAVALGVPTSVTPYYLVPVGHPAPGG